MAYEEINNFTMPICHVIMFHKSLYSYKKIFQEFKNLLNGYNISLNSKNLIIKCDFEKSLIRKIREEFEGARIYGCYFHYIMELWKKARKIGITTKNYMDKTKIIIFAYKLYPFIPKKIKNFI
jgi:hypothetical protein